MDNTTILERWVVVGEDEVADVLRREIKLEENNSCPFFRKNAVDNTQQRRKDGFLWAKLTAKPNMQ